MDLIASVQNPRIKAWKKLHTKKGRDKSGLFFIEGEHLIEEAVRSDIVLKELIIKEGKEVPKEWQVLTTPQVFVTEAVMNDLSDTETPQGCAAICEMPPLKNLPLDDGRFLFVDGVQDPGNLGAMIRTADAAGISGVIIGEGTVDIYNGKVIRSTQGSLFHIPVQKMKLEDAVEICKEAGVPVFGTSLKGSTFNALAPQDKFALIMGNEGDGIREELLKMTDHNLYIPIYGEAESLNVAVACGIVLYHLRGL